MGRQPARRPAAKPGMTTAAKQATTDAATDPRTLKGPALRAARAAVDDAQLLIYDAWELPPGQRKPIAIRALQISPLCADAHGMLAALSPPGSDEELALWQRAVAAGTLAIGKKGFEELAGEFWGWLETRPYMRSMFGLAVAEWRRGLREAAIARLQEMIRLNPNDNQGVRDVLAFWLLECGQDAAFDALNAQYEDDWSALLIYAGTLAEFRRSGESEESANALRRALMRNPLVPELLLGRRKRPERRAATYAMGSLEEAFYVVDEGEGAWRSTAGALEWLARHAPPLKASSRRGSPAAITKE